MCEQLFKEKRKTKKFHKENTFQKSMKRLVAIERRNLQRNDSKLNVNENEDNVTLLQKGAKNLYKHHKQFIIDTFKKKEKRNENKKEGKKHKENLMLF